MFVTVGLLGTFEFVMKRIHIALSSVAVLALVATAAPQLKAVLKVVGVGAAVKQFGPDINKSLNKLVKHTDTDKQFTKVVPILSGGVSSRQAIGAAQVMGPKAAVEKVGSVVQLDQDILGREVKIRAMIPIEGTDVTRLNRVEGVGVSGTVDLKL